MILAAASIGLAAETTHPQMTTQAPFPSEITGKQMPAGKYTLIHSGEKPYAAVRRVATGTGFLFDARTGAGYC